LAKVPAAPEERPARRDLLALLESLPVAQRHAIALTKIEGLSMAEASAVPNPPPPPARRR
jgi:RNA polymerase sigma-70 factor (ECF subfamily)